MSVVCNVWFAYLACLRNEEVYMYDPFDDKYFGWRMVAAALLPFVAGYLVYQLTNLTMSKLKGRFVITLNKPKQ